MTDPLTMRFRAALKKLNASRIDVRFAGERFLVLAYRSFESAKAEALAEIKRREAEGTATIPWHEFNELIEKKQETAIRSANAATIGEALDALMAERFQ